MALYYDLPRRIVIWFGLLLKNSIYPTGWTSLQRYLQVDIKTSIKVFVFWNFWFIQMEKRQFNKRSGLEWNFKKTKFLKQFILNQKLLKSNLVLKNMKECKSIPAELIIVAIYKQRVVSNTIALQLLPKSN